MNVKNKKALLFFTIIVLCTVLLPLSAIAHSGRTDSDGGHYDSSTGEYHYHHGYSAHQHPGGVCPYERDSTPNKGSVSNSALLSTSSDKNDENVDVYDIYGFIMVSLGFGILYFLLALFVFSKIKTERAYKIAGWIIFILWIITSLYIGIRDYLT